MIQVGSVLRFTQFRAGDNKSYHDARDLCTADNPIWGVVSFYSGDDAYMYWICGGDTDMREARGPEDWNFELVGKDYPGRWDCWTEVDPNQWPDEVCAAVVKTMLTKEIAG